MTPVALGEVLVDIEAGKSFRTTEIAARPDELGILKVSAVTWSEFRPQEAKALNDGYVPDPRHRVRREDLIISRANTRELVGAVVQAERDYPMRLLSDKTLRLVVNEARALKPYLIFALRAAPARAHIERCATGSNDSMRNISHGVIRAIPVPLPKLDEQRQIAEDLRRQMSFAHHAREAAETQVRDAAALAAAIYRDAFHHIPPIQPARARRVAPDGWRWRKLTDVARLESGHTPSRLQPDWWGGEVSWLSLTEIRALDGRWVEATQIRTNPDGIANSAARVLPAGTVCLSRTASVGYAAIMARPMATSQDFANWVCGEELDPEYLMHALIASRETLRDMASGATHKTIYMPALGGLQVCAPDIAEQREVARRIRLKLEPVHTLRSTLHAQAADLAALPQRLLARTFVS